MKKINPGGSKTLYVGGIYSIPFGDEVDKASGGSVTRTVTYYPVGGAMRINNTLYYILKDHLGSASMITDSSGVEVGEQRYYPFGEARLTTGTIYTDKLFTGQREIAGLGIYHYQARFYSPKIGRFLSADTIVPNYANPHTLNRYSYVLNNPLRYIDPTGHVCTDPEDPNPTCFGSGTTRVGNRMIRGNHGELGKAKNKFSWPKPSSARRVGFSYKSFQMFQVTDPYYYGQSANESYTDFPGGGEPQYVPQVYGARNNRIPKARVGDLFGLGNDLLLGYRPTYLRENTPYDQGVFLTYETTFQNTPSVDAVEIVTLTSITIHNGSNINSVIHYSVYVSTGTDQMSSDAAAAPGQSSDVPLSGGLEVYETSTGFGIIIQANTGCVGPCFTAPNAPLFQGSIIFNVNP